MRLNRLWMTIVITLAMTASVLAQTARQKVILDTDIGDDIDDAFAMALVLSSPDIDLLGVSTSWGDTQLRARLVDRMLCETGRSGIPVRAGIATKSAGPLTQARWAQAFPAPPQPYASSVDFLLDQIRRNPGEITLIAIGPLTNVGAAIDRDPETFRKLKRVVIMGGSIRRGYGDVGYAPDHGPDAEYNIVTDIAAARKLFAAGVPLFVMPLDSTQLKLDEDKRQQLFRLGTPLTDALALLYFQWGQQTPTLFDPIAVAYALQPEVCPIQPMHIEVDDKGYTRETSGKPNAQVCLNSNSDAFFRLYMRHVLEQKMVGKCCR